MTNALQHTPPKMGVPETFFYKLKFEK